MDKFKFTLKAWPVIAAATIGLCYLTQAVAKWFGIELPDQQNIDIVRRCGLHAFDSLKHFGDFAFLCAQVIVLLPVAEELVFRGLLFKLPSSKITWPKDSVIRLFGYSVISSALFSSAHYLAQPWPDAAFLALFFFGLAQCWLYRKTGKLWCAIVNHTLFNLTNLILLFLVPETAS